MQRHDALADARHAHHQRRAAEKVSAVHDLVEARDAGRHTRRRIERGGRVATRIPRGLDAPILEVTLFKADGGELGTLVVGKRDGERVFARTATSPVYAVSAKQMGDPPKVPDDFKG